VYVPAVDGAVQTAAKFPLLAVPPAGYEKRTVLAGSAKVTLVAAVAVALVPKVPAVAVRAIVVAY
jgi:hypothetical protein